MSGRGKGGKALVRRPTKGGKKRKSGGSKVKKAPAKKKKAKKVGAKKAECMNKKKPTVQCGPKGGMFVERMKGNKMVKRYV